MPKPKVVIEGVVKRFGAFEAVKHLDLTVDDGEFLTLLGPSGCGKTTTLALIAGFEYPTEGRIRLDQTDVTNRPPFLRNVNTVFQNYALFPHMTVFENVAFGLRVRRVGRAELEQRVRQALAMVQMESFAERPPRQLSGGQQQRVALARAIVLRPDVLLLDEPLGALDLKLRKEMQVELKHLQQKLGITFVFVTHDQEEALTMSDRIVVMNKGRIEQIGTPTEIYERPRTRFVAEFIGETNLLAARVHGSGASAAQVEVAGLRLSMSAAELPRGDQILLSIRPERVRVATQDEQAITAVVSDRIYVGSSVKLITKTESGTVLMASGQPGSSLAGVQPGDSVRLTWGPNDCVPLATAEGVAG